ncbi:putative ph domain-containing protein [Phaeoacremonium minimum UCRPA7]|uniref:Putative ph domain-containing protein n=1 Tax=Phaeoacremonium minimum (strain UCR-PA7) TaxID=1286976 RepID=R8BR66_PHAM7|nr:putative ph domain-containing protein [Phaeoacremonium minimum UCRPA7]EOO01829.1 putative ph domain-containing protein [Phaeoacremonium minimum UCRPA7]
MASWSAFLLTYLLGGVTFIPLVLITVLLHAYLTLPYRDDVEPKPIETTDDDIIQPGDDLGLLKATQKELRDEEKPKNNHHETEVAAGYFAVCREYTPMGINAKPIERSTPVGSTTVAAPSPSVYQTMYRSIFERKHTPGPLDNNKSISQRPKKAGNVFYVVLRHGHLMLFDDDEQLEVRHVISLAHHDISIFSGGDTTPEGELFIKRNALCLSRRTDGKELGPDSQISKPFYLFSENCSAKEDFYFALLRNQEQYFTTDGRAPAPLNFEVKDIIALVQKLHSSEDQLQTKWLNAMIGRIFLALYKTADIENFIREKLTKKISRVKRPAFLSNITIQKIDTGESAPIFTNPRLKDLTVEGECCIEADVRYTGNFRLEVAAVARIELGTRLKAREVNLVLAVVVRKLEGHAYFKIKPPPSNRLWFTFQQMPKIEMTIEPIVSTRQITYTVILRQIENRIKEVIAETLVLPFWDDTPFFRTEHKKWRGGIWVGDDAVQSSGDLETTITQVGDVDDVDTIENGGLPSPGELPPMEKSHSVPVIESTATTGLFGRKLSNKNAKDQKANASSG